MKKKIVILGAGYAGLRVAKEIEDEHKNADITLVNKNDYHYESISLHEVAAGTRSPNKVKLNITDVIDPDKINFIQDEVVKINPEQKQINLKNHNQLNYDYLVVALGFESESFGIKGVAENTLPLENVPTALAIQKHVEERFTQYAKTKDENDLSIIVCGAGFTSIEYLGELTNKIEDYRSQLNIPKPKITCVEASDHILPMFPKDLADYAVDRLKERGVNFYVGARIQEAFPNKVVFEQEGKQIEVYGNSIIWTTGVKGSHVIAESGFEQRRNRIMVESDLTIKKYPEIFVIGDCAAVMNPENDRPYPTTAQISLAQAEIAAKNLQHKLNHEPTEDFVYESLGTVCSLGDNEAIGIVGKKQRKFKGYIASVLKKVIANRSIHEVSNLNQMFKKGRFDFYH